MHKATEVMGTIGSYCLRLVGAGCLLLAMLGSSGKVYGQERAKIGISAHDMESAVVNGEVCSKLSGDVVVQLEEGTLRAPRAIYYQKSRVIEAEGGIEFTDKEGAVVKAERLTYEEKTSLVQLRGHIVYQSGAMTVYTDSLNYNIKTKQGHFVQGGRLVEGENVLTSSSGSYNDHTKEATFKGEVRLESPDYTVQCDTLHYNTVTKIARFKGLPTQIASKDGKQVLKTEAWVEYNTGSQESVFEQGMVETEQYKLYGDRFVVDQDKEVYIVTGHVRLLAKEEGLEVSGDYCEYQKKQGVAKLYGNALMTKFLEGDPLYLSADTFEAIENKSTHDSRDNVVKAYHNVKLYKQDFQGKADSVVYREADDTLYFYGDTVFWQHDNQLTADEVRVLFKDKALSEMHLTTNVFIASEDDGGHFNQLQGKELVAYFKENKADRIEIDGNVESVYFLLNDQGKLTALNHLKCSHIQVLIEKGEIASMTIPPRACSQWEIHPPHKIPEELRKLSNFTWRINERPTKQDVVGHGYGTQKGYPQFKFDLQQEGSTP